MYLRNNNVTISTLCYYDDKCSFASNWRFLFERELIRMYADYKRLPEEKNNYH